MCTMASAFLSPLRSYYSETFSLRHSLFCHRILKFPAIVAWGGYFRLCPCLVDKATWGSQRLADTNARLAHKPLYWCYAAPKVVSALEGGGGTLVHFNTLSVCRSLHLYVYPQTLHQLQIQRRVINCLSQVHSLVRLWKQFKMNTNKYMGRIWWWI